MQIGWLIGAEPVAHAAHEHRDVGTLAAAVGVKLVEHEEIEAVALAMTARSSAFCRVISSSSIMKLVSRMSGFASRMRSRSSWLSWPV